MLVEFNIDTKVWAVLFTIEYIPDINCCTIIFLCFNIDIHY